MNTSASSTGIATPALAWEFVRRELRLRYLGTFSGGLWALFQPLFQLLIFGYVFARIFQAKLPAGEYGDLPFITFLAVGLWPWTAFSESLSRASTAVLDNAGLLGKIALPRPLLVFAPVCAGMLLHFIGFVLVLTLLTAVGMLTPRASMVWICPLFLLVMLFTLGLAWLMSAISVFVRDFTHILAQALALGFFLTPVVYPRSLVPEALQPLSDLNPMALYVGMFRDIVLGTAAVTMHQVLAGAGIAILTAAAGLWMFRRLSPHFEDFL